MSKLDLSMIKKAAAGSNLTERVTTEYIDKLITKIPADLCEAIQSKVFNFTAFARQAILEKAQRDGIF